MQRSLRRGLLLLVTCRIMPLVTGFYCDHTCEARLVQASTIDREFKALVDLFNQTTGGPRSVYRGAYEGLGGGLSTRSLWTHKNGWDTILSAHTATKALCTELKLDFVQGGATQTNRTFTRDSCYEHINASSVGPIFPDPEWSIIEDCCLKFNRTVRSGAPVLRPIVRD